MVKATLALSVIGASIVAAGGSGRLIDPTGRLAPMPIGVPGDVHSALLASGQIPDPYFGTNECQVAWVGEQDWIVEWDFVVSPEQATCKRVALRLEDVDTLCDLSLNGRELGSTHNRFRRFEFEIKGLVRPGRNTLRGTFHSVVEAKEAEARKYNHSYWVHGPVLQNLNLIRKPFCHGGWDWGPRILSVGFMKEPELIATDGITIDYVHCETGFSDDYARATVDITVDYTRADGTRNVKVERRTIDRPTLWWPRGLGEQNFTEVSLDVEGVTIRKRLGLRRIELVTERDADGTSCFSV